MARKQIFAYVLRSKQAYLFTLAFMGLIASTTLPAAAESTCVVCSGPEAAYECNAYASDPIPGNALALFCTSRIAGDYGHKSCSVEQTKAACTGLPVHFPYEPDLDTTLGLKKDERADGNKEPETLGELASDTYDASKQTISNSGEAIGNAAEKAGNAIIGVGDSINDATKKTFDCIKSALSGC